ncbi:MAG: penicillin-binding protein activator [Gammaproteobacteria bacterium]|nr:penicillin-binding protein activator [Gammaproteobacteria bacterium]MCW8959722.1 penicillin-binding protein activator [Gammaproteobacteria bacterium]MCW8971919.1 penicillin-binding protein activator [Gammaproteobacteria bacterium]MCW8991778.1 penicillin-binding protein activator [Gammaproteobacteria bacterium]MCW9088858.1 penicillin-binding protein activator [Gammaproteobacteria bacterium]
MAARAMLEGDYERAISLYRQLAETSPSPESHEYRYLAAQAMFRAGLSNQANEQLDILAGRALTPDLRMKLQLLRAELPIKRDPTITLELLRTPAVMEHQLALSNELYARYHLLRARAFAQLGEQFDASREYIVRELYLQHPAHIEANQLAIWQSLSLLSTRSLRQQQLQPPPDVLSGWVELVKISRDYTLSPQAVQQRLNDWRQRYRGHPAGERLLQMLVERSRELAERPANIALLLPLSGRYAAAAQAIQDGLLAAYYQDPRRDTITLRIYDLGDDPEQVERVYQRAVDEGAEFVIGPLDKGAVERLANKQTLPAPTLALNYAKTPDNERLYQFTLSPEDEAREVAERAWQEGHTRAAVLLPKSSLGDRLAEAFAERWQALGGTLASENRYDPEVNDFSIPIKSLLNLSDSELRKRRLNQLMAGGLEFIPRRRQDVDFIFISAFPRQARLLRPQLKFHHAGDLPILATSHLYNGQLNRDADRDMDDITFCDMPWTLSGDSPQQALRQKNAAEFQRHSGQLQRLVALGVDAYQLVPLLPILESSPFEHYRGETGKLSVTEDQRVKRSLLWAQFISGTPRLLQERVMEVDGNWQDTN